MPVCTALKRQTHKNTAHHLGRHRSQHTAIAVNQRSSIFILLPSANRKLRLCILNTRAQGRARARYDRGGLECLAEESTQSVADSSVAAPGNPEIALAAKDRVNLGGVEVSPLGIGAWAWGDTAFWGYSEAMDKELQEASYFPYNS